MSFDKTTRNALARMVADCRRLLTADLRDQLQRRYGLQPDGSALAVERLAHLDDRGRETARALRGCSRDGRGNTGRSRTCDPARSRRAG